ncbi:MAG: histidinol-phosphate transaminase [Bifidobacteriaceae bacterium]|nr:histidinol-phosphate transaminase [Bifidobacteriaceae bacterium]
MTKVPIRPTIDALPAYVPGGKPPAGKVAFKLSSNELPYPPLPGVLAAVADAAADLHRYPSMMADELVAAIAAFHGVDPSQVTVGAGSVGVLGHILATVAGDGTEVAFPWRSFEAYPILAGIAGAAAVTTPLDADARLDLAALAGAITERTRAVLVCTPNNPTGPAVHQAEFEAFMDQIPSDVLVVLDEAYVEFVTDPDAVQSAPLLDRYANLVVLRTFSKAYGLAGLRVGYAIGKPRLMQAVRSATTPFSVSGPAQLAAIVSLTLQAELRERVAGVIENRQYMLDELRRQGWQVPDAQGNFVWLALGADAAPFAQACSNARVIVRPFAGDGVRVSVGEKAGVDRFLEVAATWA